MAQSNQTNFPIAGNIFVDGNGVLTKQSFTLLRTLWQNSNGASIVAVQTTADAALALAQSALQQAKDLSDLANVPAARGNLGLGSVALGNTVPGWAAPTGSGSRASFNANASTTAGASYTQAQVQAINDQLVAVQKALAQLILDAESAKLISP